MDARNSIQKKEFLSDRKFMKWVSDGIFQAKPFSRK